MISLKISISVQGAAEVRTKIKLESDSPDKTLPFENLLVETIPSETEGTDFRLHFTNLNRHEPKEIKSSASFKNWWKRFLAYYFNPVDAQNETIKKEPVN